MDTNREREWTRNGRQTNRGWTSRRARAMAGKLQIYADEGTPGALHQSPDEQELVPTVRTFASLREILSSLT
jgi:hypothetical protein